MNSLVVHLTYVYILLYIASQYSLLDYNQICLDLEWDSLLAFSQRIADKQLVTSKRVFMKVHRY